MRRFYLPTFVIAVVGIAQAASGALHLDQNGVQLTATRSPQQQARSTTGSLLWLLYLCDAGLLIASGVIHLHLWQIAYRNVHTLDVLFLVQVTAAVLAALALLVTRHLIVVIAAAAMMAGAIVGFVLARTVGIFGFHRTFSPGLAYAVLVVEAAAVVLLSLTGWRMVTDKRS